MLRIRLHDESHASTTPLSLAAGGVTPLLAGLFLVGLGCFVLAGWAIGSEPMVRLLPGSTAMAINTALQFLLVGTALLLYSRRTGSHVAQKGIGWVLVALPAAILFQHVFDVDLGIDWASVHAAVGDGHAKPGRTAPNACVGFACCGAVLLMLRRDGVVAHRIRLGLAGLALALGVSAFVGYQLDLPAFYRFAAYNQMAALTAIGMTAAGLGMLALAFDAAPRAAAPDAATITWLSGLLLTVFALATGLTAFAVLKKGYEDSASESLRNAGRTNALSVSALLEKNAVLASAMAGRPVIASSLAALGAAPGNGAAAEALRREEQSFLALGFASAVVSDALGRRVSVAGRIDASPPLVSIPLPTDQGRAWLMWRNGFVYRSERPVHHGGTAVGRVELERDLPELDALLAEAQKIGRTSDVVLCARAGDRAQCFPSRFYAEPISVALFDKDGRPALPIARALLGETGSQRLRDPRGVPVLAAHVPLPRQQLGLVQKMETQELYLPLRDNLSFLLVATLLYIAAGSLLLRKWVSPMVRRIADERRRMRAILDNSTDAFVAVDSRGRVTDWNESAQRLFGWTEQQAVGRPLSELAGREQPWALQAVPQPDRPVARRRMEGVAITRAGLPVEVEISIAPYTDGGSASASIFLRDMTLARRSMAELEQARHALSQAQKLEAIGKLTGGVAHDFNNVLQVIGSNLQLLQLQSATTGQGRLVEAALSACQRGAKLSSQLLAFARRQPLQPVTFDLNRRVQDMGDLLRRSLGEPIELETVLAGGLWLAVADPHQLENVILNLAINARDAMPSGGKLTIETANAVLDESYTAAVQDVRPGQYVMLAVSDTGTGMPPEVAARAFEPFFTTKPEGKGTGLGLSMAYGFAKQSSGHIRIYSEPGEGTTVKLYLPRSSDKLAAEPPQPSALANVPPRGTESVLVVEDDADVQNAAVSMLQALGYRTLCASHAQAAVDVLARERVDLLFTDVVMPGPMKSTELARRAAELQPGIAVLFTSGYTQNAIVHGGRLDPGVQLLSKPYRREELARKVRAVLDLRARQAAGAAPPAAAAPAAGPTRVLLVEDEEELRVTAQELLQLLDAKVVAVGSAEAADRLLREQAFDILITDVSLPGGNGIDLAVSAAARDPALKIVFATGYGAQISIPPQLRHHILAKPFGVEELELVLGR